MNTYEVIDTTISDPEQAIVYRYTNDTQVTLDAYPAGRYMQRLQVEPVIQAPAQSADPYATLIDIGPYFDRFGPAKIAVLSSQDPVVQALVKDASVRKWIDLSRADVIQALAYIASKVPSVTQDIEAAVLATPVQGLENADLRMRKVLG